MVFVNFCLGPRHDRPQTQMLQDRSSVETGQMSAVKAGQMSAAKTGRMSAAETKQMSTAVTGGLH